MFITIEQKIIETEFGVFERADLEDDFEEGDFDIIFTPKNWGVGPIRQEHCFRRFSLREKWKYTNHVMEDQLDAIKVGFSILNSALKEVKSEMQVM